MAAPVLAQAPEVVLARVVTDRDGGKTAVGQVHQAVERGRPEIPLVVLDESFDARMGQLIPIEVGGLVLAPANQADLGLHACHRADGEPDLAVGSDDDGTDLMIRACFDLLAEEDLFLLAIKTQNADVGGVLAVAEVETTLSVFGYGAYVAVLRKGVDGHLPKGVAIAAEEAFFPYRPCHASRIYIHHPAESKVESLFGAAIAYLRSIENLYWNVLRVIFPGSPACPQSALAIFDHGFDAFKHHLGSAVRL